MMRLTGLTPDPTLKAPFKYAQEETRLLCVSYEMHLSHHCNGILVISRPPRLPLRA